MSADAGVMPYISKSRVKTFKTCPRQFFYQYVLGIRFPGNFYTKRGTRLHKTYEVFHEKAAAAIEEGTFDPDFMEQYLPEEWIGAWLDWVDPFVINFIKFEERRWVASLESLVGRIDDGRDPFERACELWKPVALEAEGRLDPAPVGPEWMGFADAILHAASVPEIDRDDGYVIVDYKTGKTPDPKYREEGIFLEGEFYAALFEDEWDIAGVAGYYPKADDFIVAPLREERRELIIKAIEEMTASTDQEDFPLNEQPLCKWREGEDNECTFYRICSSRWGCSGGPGPTFPDAPDRGSQPAEGATQDDYGKRWL